MNQIRNIKNTFILITKRGYTRSGGLRKPQKVSNDPESINRKVYWWSEHKPVKRTIINLIFSHNEFKFFANLLNYYSKGSTRIIHELSLEGPYTGFVPSNEALELISQQSLDALCTKEEKLTEFILNHFVKDFWMYRDLIGSSYQPWLMYNEKRNPPEKIPNLNSKDILVTIRGTFKNCDHAVYLNESKIIRPNMKCHNGIIHVVDRPIVL